ncbi:hypothetical protein ATK74_0190 [Propionicimonas paludicola]|uniref:(S)-ureidoglycine aminohydrolase cupin domain-containing protein n=1 Tax=Propionicimonas paludicola TaxID=185243 RepID=A0A2A9CPT2_9ACTN|nr:cupin domain-containing protein [Propionicimonas paludicola]PFG15670.1 hypothetical protein ATK74_0190 [Propionicimonas paludicola]
MNPALLADALSVEIAHEPFDPEHLVAGEPTSGWLPLAEIDGVEVGIWEMTPGTITDTEGDEVLCVLAGRALVEFLDPPAAPIDLRPGSLVRLQAGWRTRWTVTQTIRKIAATREEA